jgi:DNA-binding transcriptional LysR family regulator
MQPHLQHIVDEAEIARAIAQNFRLLEKTPIRLGVMSTIGHLRLARFLASFEKTHNGMELAVSEGTMQQLAGRLQDNKIDIAIMTRTGTLSECFRTQPLYSERYVVVFPPEHRLGSFNSVELADLSGEQYVDRLACEMREMVMAVCAGFRSEREDWVQAMVLAGIGFAFMPEFSVTLPGLMQRPLTEPAVERQICIVSVPGRPHTPTVDAFIRATRSFPWPG